MDLDDVIELYAGVPAHECTSRAGEFFRAMGLEREDRYEIVVARRIRAARAIVVPRVRDGERRE